MSKFKNMLHIGSNFLDYCNQFLIVVTALLIGYIAFLFLKPQSNFLEPTHQTVKVERNQSMMDLAVMSKKPFKIYEENLKSRSLFEPFKNDLKADPKVMQKVMPALHKQIKLIGILMDSDSKAIVEDLKENQTHFLSKGESLGSVILNDIQEDKVIFQYDDELIEMAP